MITDEIKSHEENLLSHEIHRNPATLSHTPSGDHETNIFEEIPLSFVLTVCEFTISE